MVHHCVCLSRGRAHAGSSLSRRAVVGSPSRAELPFLAGWSLCRDDGRHLWVETGGAPSVSRRGYIECPLVYGAGAGGVYRCRPEGCVGVVAAWGRSCCAEEKIPPTCPERQVCRWAGLEAVCAVDTAGGGGSGFGRRGGGECACFSSLEEGLGVGPAWPAVWSVNALVFAVGAWFGDAREGSFPRRPNGVWGKFVVCGAPKEILILGPSRAPVKGAYVFKWSWRDRSAESLGVWTTLRVVVALEIGLVVCSVERWERAWIARL